MKLSKGQIKRIIREEKRKLQELDFSGPARGNDYEALMAQAVQACKDAGLSMEEIIVLCEYEIMERDQ